MLSNRAYMRLAKSLRRGMPFLADPPVPQSEKYKGIIEYPGFHTTGDFDIAANYALGRVNASATEEDEGGIHYVTDYPVVVALDMSGFEKLTDYDAEKIVKDVLEIHLRELVDHHGIDQDSSDNDILDYAQDYVEGSDWGSEERLEGPYDFIYDSNFSHMDNPIAGIAGLPGFADMVRSYLSSGQIPSDFLMEATRQYRYENDVESSRVVAVWFVQPVADAVLDYDTDEEEINSLWPGFDIFDQDSLYSGNISFNTTLVYGQPEGNLEYHGTTYLRFKQAAPEVDIPDPPSPPFLQN